MRLDFLIDTPLDADGDAIRASARYRAILPGRALADLGWSVRMLTLDQVERGAYRPDDPPDVLVLGKLFRPGGGGYLDASLAAGARLVVDFCDDNFERYNFDGAYGQYLASATLLTASTDTLADLVAERLGRRPAVIGDPIEGPTAPPRFAPDPKRVRLVWYGASSSLETLRPLADGMTRWRERSTALAGRAVHLAVATAINQLDPALAAILLKLDRRCDLLIKIWRLRSLWPLLAASDIVVLPTLDGAFYGAKSPNRLLEALNAGRAAAVQPLPSYAPFLAGCCADADIFTALDAALVDPAATRERIAAGQALARTLASPQAIAAQWAAALTPLAARG